MDGFSERSRQRQARRNIEVTLNWHEVEMAAPVGLRRRLESLRAGLHGASGCDDEDSWSRDIEAAAAEMAFAKVAGLYWDGSVNTFKAPDVGRVWQVRWTEREDGSLIVRPGDSDDDLFVLVVGRIPSFRVVGWIEGYVAKAPHRLKTPNGRPPAYFLDQTCLEPLDIGRPPC